MRENKKKSKFGLNQFLSTNGNIALIKKDIGNNKVSNTTKVPTNVEGHYPSFMSPGAVNLLDKDKREMSIILESFLPQLDKIGVQIKDINLLIREIITSTKVFRRLRGVSQIELLPFAFPQVPWFTRYTHSCLTYVFAEHIIDKLNENLKLTKTDLEAAKLSFLIHDLGHGPFSHLTERAFKVPRGQKGLVPKEYDHEYWTRILLNELQECLFDTTHNPYLPKGVSTKPESLKKSNRYNLEIFSKSLLILSKHHDYIISQLLSSQVDIDRLSNYLGDRLTVSGILEEENLKKEEMIKHLSTYNNTVENIKRIMNGFVIVDRDLRGDRCGKYLAIHEDAVTPVIHFLLDRHIIRYYLLKHHRREAANNILEKILLRAQHLVRKRELDAIGKTDLLIITWLYGNHTEAEFVELDDQLLFNQIRKWAKHAKDPILKDLTLRFTAHSFFNTFSFEKNGKPHETTAEILEKIKIHIQDNLKISGISKELIGEYYFTYDETTSVPYHTERDEVIIYTSNKKVKKLSTYIKETNHELGNLLLNTKFKRYQVIIPPEVKL